MFPLTFRHRAGVSPYTSPFGFAETCVFDKQSLGPFHCGHFSVAPLIPKLRGQFAEFLNNPSPAGLRFLTPSTCVGLRYGRVSTLHVSFSRRLLSSSSLLYFSVPFDPGDHRRATALSTCQIPYAPRPRNIHRVCIDYASRPRLSSRLTQGGRAFPWNPWTFGHRDSRAILATHSGILTPIQSTSPFDDASPRIRRSPTNTFVFLSFGYMLSPVEFSARRHSTSELLRTLLMCGCF